jgi:hypothetical protein
MQSVVKQWELRSSRMPERVRPCHRCGSKANTRTKGTGLAPLVEYSWGHEFVLMQMFVLPVRHCRFQNRGVRDRGKTSVTFSSALLWRMLCFFDEGSLEVSLWQTWQLLADFMVPWVRWQIVVRTTNSWQHIFAQKPATALGSCTTVSRIVLRGSLCKDPVCSTKRKCKVC